MMRRPRRAGSRTSTGTPSSGPATKSYSGVKASSAWNAVSESPAVHMKRSTSRCERRSRDSAVEAESNMRIGDSMSSATGNTTPP